MMKRFLAFAIIALVLSGLSETTAQAQDPDPECALSMWVVGDFHVSLHGMRLVWATNNTSTPVELRSITYGWGPAASLPLKKIEWATSGETIWTGTDSSGEITHTTSAMIQPGAREGMIFFLGDSTVAPSIETATCSSYTPPTPTPTPAPTATPTPLPQNQWGHALSSTTIVKQDFQAQMAIDFEPYEIPEPSLDLPALSFGVAELSGIAKSATTLWAMVDNLGILPQFMLIALAVALVFWLYRFVTDLPTPAPDVDLTGAMDAYTGYDDIDADSIIGNERSIMSAIDARGGRNSDLGQSIYDDSLARLESAQERKARNTSRRRAVREATSFNKRLRKLF